MERPKLMSFADLSKRAGAMSGKLRRRHRDSVVPVLHIAGTTETPRRLAHTESMRAPKKPATCPSVGEVEKHVNLSR